ATVAAMPRLVAVEAGAAPLDLRARSYLDANCAHCHRPGHPIRATFDARFDASVVGAAVVSDSLGLTEPRVIVPGDAARSMALHRMTRADGFRMPPLASNVPDRAAIAVLTEWGKGLAVSIADPYKNGRDHGADHR